MENKLLKELVDETRAVKKLLILQLLRNDVPQRQIASMLEISEATMSRMIPRGTMVRKPRSATSKIVGREEGHEHE
ncbi:Trp family transcriptional regulator [Chelativorans salis]|uniref:Trp family transcriptional regulator n=1 Tax=Chelativorans salis TaxID=2978478 RepID=A0ABT2LKS4_9HYPH|nr:Trp family transcriptional regulator [Chelativorans sp. EGI FJ00035]MCT7374412.1 Trp family transcriptional regulator [Chelativorans sp. EGI FJ00035]